MTASTTLSWTARRAGIELFHGYTYSGHPLACAAAIATIDLHCDEGLADRAAALAPYWEEAVHGLQGLPLVIDIRNLGLMAAVELEARPEHPGERGGAVFRRCFDLGLLTRVTGDTIALSPPLVIENPGHRPHRVDPGRRDPGGSVAAARCATARAAGHAAAVAVRGPRPVRGDQRRARRAALSPADDGGRFGRDVRPAGRAFRRKRLGLLGRGAQGGRPASSASAG